MAIVKIRPTIERAIELECERAYSSALANGLSAIRDYVNGPKFYNENTGPIGPYVSCADIELRVREIKSAAFDASNERRAELANCQHCGHRADSHDANHTGYNRWDNCIECQRDGIHTSHVFHTAYELTYGE